MEVPADMEGGREWGEEDTESLTEVHRFVC